MAISSPGLGSNLDVSSIVSQLMALERQPLSRLDVKEASYQAQLSAFGSVKSSLSSFQTAVRGLTNTTTFQSLKATPSDATILTASAVSTAIAGTYSIEVSKLAQSQKLAAVGQSGVSGAIGTGTLTFDFGTISAATFDSVTGHYSAATFTGDGGASKTVTISSTSNTLSGIRDAINTAKIGVTATIVNDGGVAPYRLVLSSDKTGIASSMKISVSGDAALSSLLSHDPAGVQGFAETVTAQNAEMKVNGVSASKSSNSVSDVINGVTLNLAKVTTSPVSVTVARDTGAIKSAVDAFVKTFNEVNKTFKDVSAYDANAKVGAILQGDTVVRTLQSQIRGVLSSRQADVSVSFSNLSQIGVSVQKDGSISVDAAKLQSAISSNPDEVSSLVAAVGNATNSVLDNVLGAGGAISSRTDGISRSIKDIGIQRSALSSRLVNTEQRYRAQFTALDTLIAGMTQTSNFLTQQLEALRSST